MIINPGAQPAPGKCPFILALCPGRVSYPTAHLQLRSHGRSVLRVGTQEMGLFVSGGCRSQETPRAARERGMCPPLLESQWSFNQPALKRNEYKYDLKAEDGQDSATGSISPKTPGNTTLDLDEVAHKLEIARSEYQRRLKEVRSQHLCQSFRNRLPSALS